MSTIERPPRPDGNGPKAEVSKRVYDVCTDLIGRNVSDADRTTLRKELDKADKPLTGRDAGDAAILGRASKRTEMLSPDVIEADDQRFTRL